MEVQADAFVGSLPNASSHLQEGAHNGVRVRTESDPAKDNQRPRFEVERAYFSKGSNTRLHLVRTVLKGMPNLLVVKRFDLKADLEAEVRACESFGSFPFFVRYYGRFRADCVMFEWCKCDTFDAIRRHGPPPTHVCKKVALAVLTALSYLEKAGWVYTDLKTENVLFARNGVPKVGDMGSCVPLSLFDESAQPNAYIYTERFLPPSFSKTGGRYFASSCLWPYALMLCELLTARSWLAFASRWNAVDVQPAIDKCVSGLKNRGTSVSACSIVNTALLGGNSTLLVGLDSLYTGHGHVSRLLQHPWFWNTDLQAFGDVQTDWFSLEIPRRANVSVEH
jgi:serine/threonine protein kinase